jgi:hypothetical protein
MKIYRYDLDIWEIKEIGGGPILSYQSKGHHDENAFAVWLEQDYVLKVPDRDKVMWAYQRAVPSADGDGMMLVNCKESGRGAYPVTYINIEHVEDAEL